MYLQALATSNPSANFSQKDCWRIAKESSAIRSLNRRTALTLRTILLGDSGINTRQFATAPLDRVFDFNADELNAIFRKQAPKLASEALNKALNAAGLNPSQITALLVCTCTGYLCPGVSSYVAEQLGLRPNTFLQDLVGLGCGAAIPTLRAAQAILASQPDATVACIAVEICSAAFFLDDDPGVIISACLFGDGAAATIWRNTPGSSSLRCSHFNTLHIPQQRDKLRFEQSNGKLRNLLHSAVPDLAATAVSNLFAQDSRSNPRPVQKIIAHPGGRDVINSIEAAIPGYPLSHSRTVLYNHGNMSSPSVLFALQQALQTDHPTPQSDWWLTSFGAGFSAHSCRIGI